MTIQDYAVIAIAEFLSGTKVIKPIKGFTSDENYLYYRGQYICYKIGRNVFPCTGKFESLVMSTACRLRYNC